MKENVSDKMCACFKNLVKRHVATIPDSQYAEYLAQSKNDDSVYPNYDLYRGYGLGVSREALVDTACSIGGSATEYFSAMLAAPHQIIGSIRLSVDNSESVIPVYFFSEMGVYAAALNESRVVEVWLSWPAYPRGW